MLDSTSDKFYNELNSGEKMIWSGQPAQGLMLRQSDIFMIPFSLMWGGFAIFWEFTAVAGGAPFFFMLWGIPFVLVGLYMIIGRFFFDSFQRSKTYYAVTNERAIIISGVFNQTTQSLDIKKLPEISISTQSNGKGPITFGASSPMAWMYAGGGFPNMGKQTIAPNFEMIEDSKTVYQYIKQVQKGEL